MRTIVFVGLALATGLPSWDPGTAQIKVTRFPPETVRTSTAYDAAGHRLTIYCDAASRGLCRFTVFDGPRPISFVLRPGSRSVVLGVSGAARVCATGRNPAAACAPVPVAA